MRLKNFATLVLLSLFLTLLTSLSPSQQNLPKPTEVMQFRINSWSQRIASLWLSRYGVTEHAKSDRQELALTFDDGPDNLYTPQILDILKQHKAKATFFLVGHKAEENPAMVKRILSEGHAIGNHTYNHLNLTKVKFNQAQADIAKGQQVLAKISKQKITLFRPPYSSTNKKLTKLVESTGQQTIMWSVAPYDYSGWESQTIEQFILNRVSNGSIVVEHSAGGPAIAQTVASLPNVLTALQKQGYSFVTIPELLQE